MLLFFMSSHTLDMALGEMASPSPKERMSRHDFPRPSTGRPNTCFFSDMLPSSFMTWSLCEIVRVR